jgi:hypothetical protein
VALLMAAFSAAGLSGYLAFWIYLLSPVAGRVYAVALVPATIAVLALAARGLTREALTMLGGLAIPAVLMTFAAIFVTALGFMYGGWADPLQAAANRFSHSLPVDNEVPLMFAQALTSTHRPIPSPLFADWLSSDRPPLQTGMFLAATPLRSQVSPRTYEVTGVILQSIWILPLWALLAESRIRPVALSVGVSLLAGFTVLNTFYVWPKLLAAAFLLLLAAGLLTNAWSSLRASRLVGAGSGITAGLAMLAHEGSVFGLAAIILTMLVRRRVPSPGFVVAALLAFAACMGPWIAYQSVYDPPGNRLVKWHLAGVIGPTPQATLPALVDSYRKIGPIGAIDYKLSNVIQLVGSPSEDAGAVVALARSMLPDSGPAQQPRAAAIAQLRWIMFVRFFPGLGLMALGPLALLLAWLNGRSRGSATAEIRVAGMAWLCSSACLLVWSLFMFGPGTTLPHQGTYLPELFCLAGSALAFWAVRPWLGYVAGLASVVGNLLLYGVLVRSPAAASVGLDGRIDLAEAMLAAVALALLLAMLAVLQARPDPWSRAADGQHRRRAEAGSHATPDARVRTPS